MNTQIEINNSLALPKRRGRPPKLHPPTSEAPVQVIVGIVIHDVVQVTNPNSAYYGVLFQAGDIQKGLVHGFHMISGGRREYVTVGVDECKLIGPSKVRSKDPTSPLWKQEIAKKDA